MKQVRATFVIVAATLVVAMLAPGATAKYTLHNGEDVTQTDEVNGSEFNTCGNRLSGRVGWASSLTLEQLGGTLPASATLGASYEVFEFPEGRDPFDFQFEFDEATQQGSYVIRDGLGNIVESARRVLAFTSAPRVEIPGGPLVQIEDDGSTQFIYTDVAFDEAIDPAAAVGSTLGVKPLDQAGLRLLSVVDCTPTPTPVVASIDAQPGLSRNPVNPASTKPTLVILVKGSPTLRVRSIATAKVGDASPVTSGVFGLLSHPYDFTGDGRKDRLYFFRPSQTGLTCASTSVTIGGTLTDGTPWSGTDTIKPIRCT